MERNAAVIENRFHLELSQKVIVACCVLHNMSIVWHSDTDSDDDSEPDLDDEDDQPPAATHDRIEVRTAGQAKRDELRAHLDEMYN